MPATHMQFALVSACLLGVPVRYDGAHKRSASAILQRWLEEGRGVSVCPETAGGLPVPHPAAEIDRGAGGMAVLAGTSRVVDARGTDVTAEFVGGARGALQTAHARNIVVAVLKEGSPSCGSSEIHDGSYRGIKVRGSGVTAALLETAGVRVFSEEQFIEADDLIRKIEARCDGEIAHGG